MRTVRDSRYRLIHNLIPNARHPTLWDFINTDMWLGITNGTIKWLYNSTNATVDYFFRPEWELYDLQHDPLELKNLADEPSAQATKARLQKELWSWQAATRDQWAKLCFGDAQGGPGKHAGGCTK